MKGFLTAAWHAMLYSIARGEAWQRGRGLFRGLWALWFGERAGGAQAVRRLDRCRDCFVFNAGLQTCGHPTKGPYWNDPVTDEYLPMGCFCHMPTKVKIKAATCWLDEQTGGNDGWDEGETTV